LRSVGLSYLLLAVATAALVTTANQSATVYVAAQGTHTTTSPEITHTTTSPEITIITLPPTTFEITFVVVRSTTTTSTLTTTTTNVTHGVETQRRTSIVTETTVSTELAPTGIIGFICYKIFGSAWCFVIFGAIGGVLGLAVGVTLGRYFFTPKGVAARTYKS